ncbi:MAG: polysaccharide lyase family protein [Tepidisphaerales bacterium]
MGRPTCVRVISMFCIFTLSFIGDVRAQTLWRIGQEDGKNSEFALAPRGYSQFKEDGFFIVGQSETKKDWPYVHPGPVDQWAGGRPHVFTVIFGVSRVPASGDCALVLDLMDTQSKAPPALRVAINGQPYEVKLPAGGGDASISGQPEAGRKHKAGISFPATALKAGNNRIDITTLSGSWMLYDCVSLDAPAGVTASPVEDFTELAAVGVSPTVVEREGARVLVASASVLRIGSPADAEVRIDGKAAKTLKLATGRQTVEFTVPAVDRLRQAVVSLAVGGAEIGQRPLTLVPGVSEIVIVFKTHFDIGYTDMAKNVVQTYRTRFMDSALKVADESRSLPPSQQFAWTIPGWPMYKILQDFPGSLPERQARVRQALKERRFVLHALPFTTHTELLEPEDLVRGLGYSSRISRQLGLELPRDAKMTDVPEHAGIMATLLKHAGVDFMHIGCNMMSGSPQVPPLYWWEGPDGSRVLTMYSPDYGTGLFPPADWPHRTWLALLHTGDNHGPPRPEEVKKAVDEIARKMPGVKVRIGRLSDFADAILAEKPDLPIVRGEMPDTWIHGPMSDPAGARLARNTRPLIGAAEALNTQLRAWGQTVPDAAEPVAAAWEQSLLYGEHTWGGSIGWLQNHFAFGEAFTKEREAGRYKRSEESWEEHSNYIRQAGQIITPVLQTNLDALAGGVQQDGYRIVVYNPLPWKRSGWVDVAVKPDIAAVRAADSDQIIPVTPTGFVATDIPPLGYRTYVPAQGRAASTRITVDAPAATIDTPFFKAVLDPAKGTVKSLVEKRTGREIVDATASHGFGQFFYERFDHAQVRGYMDAYLKHRNWELDFDKPGMPPADKAPYTSAAPAGFKLRFEQAANSVAAIMEAPAGNGVHCAVTTRLVLRDNLPCADLEITLHDKPLEPMPEAGWLCLPFRADNPGFRLGRLGAILDPATGIVPGSNRHLFGINTGVAILDTNGGAAFCAMDHPLVSLETPGCWKFSRDFVPKKPVAFVNLFNNQWNTNFRLWNSGTWTSRVRIWAFGRYDADAALITPSLEARLPLLAAASDAPAGKLPPARSGLQLSRTGISITAFGDNPDGPGTVLRLWELAGVSGRLNVKLPQGMAAQAVQPLDLRGRPIGEAIPVNDGGFSVELGAFAPLSLQLANPR